eukprot:TRINITY_DN3888_c0_g1_i1.p1 TRINITY_DN3888_c0_g1~~TRINITY_DN3888_c0_g1_i1.p1  ORF type:complete len:311 (+),score=52.30 TRINITY_DN3888_c0_g1_i1:48-980(+)
MDPFKLPGEATDKIIDFLPFSTCGLLRRVSKHWRSKSQDKMKEWGQPLYENNGIWTEWKAKGMVSANGWLVYDGGETSGVQDGKEFVLIGMTEPMMFPRADYLPLTWFTVQPESVRISMTFSVSISADVILQGLITKDMSLDQHGFGLRITPTSLSLLRLKSGGEPHPFWSKTVPSSNEKKITILYSFGACFICCSAPDVASEQVDIWSPPTESDEPALYWTAPIAKHTTPPNPAALVVSSQGKTSISSLSVTGAVHPSRHQFLTPAVLPDKEKKESNSNNNNNNSNKGSGKGSGKGKKGGKGRKGKGRR